MLHVVIFPHGLLQELIAQRGEWISTVTAYCTLYCKGKYTRLFTLCTVKLNIYYMAKCHL